MELDAIFPDRVDDQALDSVAAMILAEEGKLQIAAPVAEYLPELAIARSGRARAGQATMTVQDLLRHTSG